MGTDVNRCTIVPMYLNNGIAHYLYFTHYCTDVNLPISGGLHRRTQKESVFKRNTIIEQFAQIMVFLLNMFSF